MNIGGIFSFEPLPESRNNLIPSLNKGMGDLRYLMSGRCAINLALKDFMEFDKKQVAYLPAYTCKTVSGVYIDAGYKVIYYEVDDSLTPIFEDSVLDQISLISICGYFGFVNYDESFLKKCKDRNIGIIADLTHSVFTNNAISPYADYLAFSLRKWFAVPSGGIAIKKKGKFSVCETNYHSEHLKMRSDCFMQATSSIAKADKEGFDKATALFWEAEMLLRDVYGIQKSDEKSIDIINHYQFDSMIIKRRENFSYYLENFPKLNSIKPVFSSLDNGVCPSHFCLYSSDRERIREDLEDMGIHSSIYWPVPPYIDISQYPKSKYIYDNIFSVTCDQRYGIEEIEKICNVFKQICV